MTEQHASSLPSSLEQYCTKAMHSWMSLDPDTWSIKIKHENRMPRRTDGGSAYSKAQTTNADSPQLLVVRAMSVYSSTSHCAARWSQGLARSKSSSHKPQRRRDLANMSCTSKPRLSETNRPSDMGSNVHIDPNRCAHGKTPRYFSLGTRNLWMTSVGRWLVGGTAKSPRRFRATPAQTSPALRAPPLTLRPDLSDPRHRIAPCAGG